MLNYTFAELLNIFFHLQQDLVQKKTQDDLAHEIDVGRRTIARWFAGDYTPRSPDLVERIARSLCLTAFQADLLLYSVNPTWVKYGTPRAILAATEVVRYREEDITDEGTALQAVPSIAQIEREWSIVFDEKFETNYQRWGEGTKSNGICYLERTMHNKSYVLSLQNQYHEDVFMGGDSNCCAPNIYYLTAKVAMIQGDTEDDGYGLVFEEISDECFAVFRIREKLRKASVVQTFNGGNKFNVYARQASALSVRPQDTNKLAILAIQTHHWFFINDALICHHVISRLSYTRLDVGIIAGSHQSVVCRFQDFQVRVPSAVKLDPILETSIGRSLE